MSDNKQENQIYVPLDIRRSQFGHYSKVDVKGTAICVVFTFVYLTLSIYFYGFLQFLMDTTSRAKPIALEAVVYLIIIQKLVRVFIVKEKYMLDQYLKELASYNVSISPFWNISPSGFKEIKTPYGTLTKVKYKNNKECVFIKLSKGARTRFSDRSKNYNTIAIASALVHLNKIGYSVMHVDIPEFLDIVDAFKRYEECILECEDNDQSVILSLFLDNLLSETTTKGFISSEVYIIEAESAQEKNKLDTIAFEFLSLFKDTTYIKCHIMDKNEVLALTKCLFGLDVIDTTLITTENSTIDIPLGHTKVIALYDENNKLIKQINKEYEGKMQEVDKIRFKTVTSTKKPVIKQQSKQTDRKDFLRKSTVTFEESSQKVEDILKIIQKLHTSYNIPKDTIDIVQVFKELNIDLRYSENLLNLKNSIVLGYNNIPIIEDNKVTTIGKNVVTKKTVSKSTEVNNPTKPIKSIEIKGRKKVKPNKKLGTTLSTKDLNLAKKEVKNQSTENPQKNVVTPSEKRIKKLNLGNNSNNNNNNVSKSTKKKSLLSVLHSKPTTTKPSKKAKSVTKKNISHNNSKDRSKKKLTRKH